MRLLLTRETGEMDGRDGGMGETEELARRRDGRDRGSGEMDGLDERSRRMVETDGQDRRARETRT